MFGGARDSLLLSLTPRDSVIDLHHQFILRGSALIYVDSLRLPDSSYVLDSRNGKLIITDKRFLPADTLHPRHLKIAYSYLPFSFKDMYAHRKLELQTDSVNGTEKVAVPVRSEPLTMENIFGPNFQKSGTLIRGLTIGTNQDVTVTSGFHMQFSGKVANDVEVVGSLTDDNTPIQPEGNTQTIQELDKIFVQINAPSVSGTLGDFDTKLGGTEFANISRKVEGGEAFGHSDLGTVQIVAATTRGKYNTNQFNGLDGVQGPYILTGANGENNIIVIAGTEHVYVDGNLQQRGENLDYIIDYSTSQVTFQARRLITSASRITIDFQYSDQQFARSLFAARTTTSLGKDSAVRISATYMREGDNQDAPLSTTLSDTAQQILAQAGGDRSKASYSGVNYAGIDSVTHLGKGYYIRRDTVINGKPDSVFIYAPGDSNALYTLSFTFVGAGQGTYNNVAGLQYQYVGAGNGSYVPVVYLPMPTLAQIADTRVAVALAKSVTASGEFAYSSFSLNRFSSLPDANTTGTAGSFALQFSPDKFSFGSLQAGFHARSLSPLFHPIDRIDDIEFNRNWNLPVDAVNQKQNIYEGNVTYSPVDQIALNADLGELQSGSLFATSRQQYSFATKNVKSLTANYQFQILHSAGLTGVSSSDWTRQYGDANYTVSILTPGVHFESESKKEFGFAVDSLGNPVNPAGAGDTLDQTSYRYTLVQPRLRVAPTSNFAVYGSYNFRTDDSIRNDAFTRQSSSQGAGGGLEIHNLGGVNSTVDVTVLNKAVEPAFYATSGTNNQSLAMRMQTNARELNNFITGDLYYEASTQRAAKLQKRFVLVPYGTGQYIYLGDLNHNGIQDEDEFQLTNSNDGTYTLVYVPTDQLYPVIDLKTSERVRLTPRDLFAQPSGDLQKILSALSSETYTRIEEHSTT
ncbi:MAG TPA: hypothetical protein VFA55_02660, partial [Candidatus Kapabacteria bacterium]|nr:hypothetical protein [Candidatus Kapabacteria bacterium]